MNRKSLITAALVAAGIICQASADQVVYITGSTAFRSQAYAALSDNAGGTIFDAGTIDYQAQREGSSASGCNYMVFHGKIGGTLTYLDCAWSGSEAGLATVANVAIDNDGIPLFGVPETWLKADGSVASGYSSASPTSAEKESSSHQGDLAFADTSQDSALPPIQY